MNILILVLIKELLILISRKLPNINNAITTVHITALCKYVMMETEGLAK